MDLVLLGTIVSTPLAEAISRLATFAEDEIKTFLGVHHEIRKLERALERVLFIVAHVEEGLCSTFSSNWKIWLKDVNSLVYSAEDMLESISLDISGSITPEEDPSSVRNKLLSCFSKLTVAKEISGIRQDLENIIKEMDFLYPIEMEKSNVSKSRNSGSSSSLVGCDCVVGRNDDINKILEKITLDDGVLVIPIVGIGGIGKTTLARAVFNDARLTMNKFDFKIWASVSMDFDIERITKSIMESVSGKRCKLSGLDQIQVELSKLIRGKKFLLVLDDYWSEKYGDWELLSSPFKVGSRGSKIIVTTRSIDVSRIVGSLVDFYSLKCLTNENCWDLMKIRSEVVNSALKEIGRKIAVKCKGLPLAAKVIGDVLKYKEDPMEWKSILQSEMWDLSCAKNNIFPVVTLSYYRLPCHLKRCVTYCSVFPRDYEFRVKELVLLWMAEGLICPNGKMELEEIGEDYFKNLVRRCFFQLSHVNANGDEIYKMHDVHYGMARLIRGDICFHYDETQTNEGSTLSGSIRHLSLRCGSGQSKALNGFYWYNGLRTFIVISENVGIHEVSDELLSKLNSLRVLVLSGMGLDNLPDSIGHLKYLHYLNVSDNNFNSLPESVANLHSLQTLKLERCGELVMLPKNMKKMVGLRHFQFSEAVLTQMPSGFGLLVHLQNLSAFIVGTDKGCGVGELKNMGYLRGSLCIKNLEKVLSMEEARGARLEMKPFLDKLELEWKESRPNDGEILTGLVPHENLKGLSLTNYCSPMLPSWCTSPVYKLSSICLKHCHYFDILIPLGELEHLKYLVIEDMNSWAQNVDNHISGFQSLEYLTIRDMPNLISWDTFDGSCFSRLCDFSIDSCPVLKSLPSLVESTMLCNLSISRCPMIESLPSNEELPRSLEALTILECDLLKNRCQGEDWEKIKFVPKIEIDGIAFPPGV